MASAVTKLSLSQCFSATSWRDERARAGAKPGLSPVIAETNHGRQLLHYEEWRGKLAASIRDEGGVMVQSEASPPLKMTHCNRIRKVDKDRAVDILLHDAKTPQANPAGHGLV